MNLYIVSGDYISFEKPIKVIAFEKLKIFGKKCLLKDLERAIDYIDFGILEPVSRFILLDRHVPNSSRLHDLNKFSIGVHVLIPKDKEHPTEGFTKFSELFNAAWADLYDSYESALANEGLG